jgi:glutamine amidotransferase
VVGVIDYGVGNNASVHRMIQRVGGSSISVSRPHELSTVDKVILPGVGHFDAGMYELVARGFRDALVDDIRSKRITLLGICLGMQLLCLKSEEGEQTGLGLIDAHVVKFGFNPPLGLKIPHMGWNTIATTRDNPLLPASDIERRFYFVHSYKVVTNVPEITIATCDYGGDFCAAFQNANIFGVQFHPEKSHKFGMDLMKRFVELS